MTSMQDRERRLVIRVLSSWRAVCEKRQFPRADEMTQELLGDDWPNCLIIALDDDRNPRFQYVGAVFHGPSWAVSPAQRVSDCPDGTLLKYASGFYPQILAERIPVSIGNKASLTTGPALFRAILLPLSNDDSRIDALLGAASCRDDLPDAADPPP